MTNEEAIKELRAEKNHIDTHIRIEGKDTEYYEEMGNLSEAMRMGIEALEKRKKGEWIKWNFKTFGALGDWEYKCSKCEKVYDGEYNFCPNCGADMRQEANE